MKLGEMLVRDGRLTEAQLSHALAHQGRDGGRIGTVIVELGLLDLDALTVYLGLELGIPIATGAMFERAKRSAVRLLTPAQAFRHKCVPLIVQDRQLIAAVEDPHDFDNLDALSELTGYRVIPRVSPEIRIYYYVERYFGVPRPPRFLKFGDTPRGDQTPTDQGLPAHPLPGLPPVASRPIIAPGPGPRLRRTAAAAVFDDSEALELDAEDLMVALESDEQATAEQATPGQAPSRTTRPTPAPAVAAAEYEPLSAAAAIKAIAAAGDRADIADGIMRFSAGLFDVAVLFIAKDNLALGWKASGGGAGRAYADHLLIPLDAPSLIQSAVQSEDGVVDGPITPSTVHSYLFKVLGCFEPQRATAAVISIGRRVVNILYGHRDQRAPLVASEVEQVRQVCRASADAYARLIARSKKRAGS